MHCMWYRPCTGTLIPSSAHSKLRDRDVGDVWLKFRRGARLLRGLVGMLRRFGFPREWTDSR